MLQCPYCNNKGLSILQKIFIDPAITIQCKSCGKNIGISWLSKLLFLFTLPFFFIAHILIENSFVLKAIVFTFLFLLSLYIDYEYVPIVKREKVEKK